MQADHTDADGRERQHTEYHSFDDNVDQAKADAIAEACARQAHSQMELVPTTPRKEGEDIQGGHTESNNPQQQKTKEDEGAFPHFEASKGKADAVARAWARQEHSQMERVPANMQGGHNESSNPQSKPAPTTPRTEEGVVQASYAEQQDTQANAASSDFEASKARANALAAACARQAAAQNEPMPVRVVHKQKECGHDQTLANAIGKDADNSEEASAGASAGKRTPWYERKLVWPDGHCRNCGFDFAKSLHRRHRCEQCTQIVCGHCLHSGYVLCG